MGSGRTGKGLFVVALGVLWIVLSLALPLSRAATAGLAAFALVAAVVAVLLWSPSEDGAKTGRLAGWWHGLSYSKRVNAFAAVAALLAFAGTATVLLCQPIPSKSSGRVPGDNTTTTTKTHEVGSNRDGKSVKLLKTRVLEEREPVEKTDESLLGRAVNNSAGVILVRLGLALLAAFISGLVVQRVLLGKYAVTLPFGLGGVPDITGDQTGSLDKKVKDDKALDKAVHKARDKAPTPVAPISEPRKEMIALGPNLESAVREMAAEHQIDPAAPVDKLINELSTKTELGPSGVSALQGAIELSSQAYEGAELRPEAEAWLMDVGQHLPSAIEEL